MLFNVFLSSEIQIIPSMSKDDAPKKLTGLQMPLDISSDLAKIIASKKGEQVERA